MVTLWILVTIHIYIYIYIYIYINISFIKGFSRKNEERLKKTLLFIAKLWLSRWSNHLALF